MNDLTKIIHQIFKENPNTKMSFSDIETYYEENKKLPFGNSEYSMFDFKDSIIDLHHKGIIQRTSMGGTYYLEQL